MRNAGLDEAQAGIKIAGRNVNNLRYADDTTLMAQNEDELEPIDESEREVWKSWLKTQHSETKIMASCPTFMANRWGNSLETDFIFLGSKITAYGDCSHEIKRCLLLGRKAVTNIDSILKSRDITLLTKIRLVKAMGIFSSHVWMWELDYKESWVTKNWCFWTVVLEKTLESPLDSKDSKPVHTKGNQSWIFIGKTDAEAETPILWPPDAHIWHSEKYPDAGKDWRQEEKGTTEDEIVGWYHWLNGHEFEQTLGDGKGQGSLECYSPRGCKELETTEQLNYSNN